MGGRGRDGALLLAVVALVLALGGGAGGRDAPAPAPPAAPRPAAVVPDVPLVPVPDVPLVPEAPAPDVRLVERSLSTADGPRGYLWQPSPDPGPAPLVVALHGLDGEAGAFARGTGLPAAAAGAGVALVVPRASGRAWNDGRLGRGGPDDVAFVRAVVADLVEEGVVHPGRVVVSGFSNGAGMAMVLAARHPLDWAGAVAVSGELLAGAGAVRPEPATARGGPGPPVWLSHGDADLVQPWEGRSARSPWLPALASVDETVAAFRRANDAQPQPVRSTLPGGPSLAGPVQVTTWPGPAPVRVYRLPGAGHGWPTRQDSGWSATDLVVSVAATS
ncbi:PHB depolymerase family esterase [Kineococcus sp. LSe6-4]|uniref:PHB depolymerase family esterase n=1 Tax=Kineococcus halophytocola TaxID=3234027 RepID=A0ABV4GX33_9ACTN